jgi:hypothetical protein
MVIPLPGYRRDQSQISDAVAITLPVSIRSFKSAIAAAPLVSTSGH